MIRALLLDLGNVLVRFDHGLTVDAITKETGADPERVRAALFGPLVLEFDRGSLSPPAFFRAVENGAALRRLPDDVWLGAWKRIFAPAPEALRALSRLRPGLATAVVSNTNDPHWQAVQEMLDVESLVNAVVLSFRVGAVKPDRAIFDAALLALRATPGETLFVDDRSDFVSAALDFGIQAVVCDDPGCLEARLEERGLLLPETPS